MNGGTLSESKYYVIVLAFAGCALPTIPKDPKIPINP